MENEFYPFIIDCLTSPGNAAKQQALATWLEASEEHRLLFLEVKTLWEAAGHLPATPLDRVAGWEALSQHITQTPPVVTGARIRRMPARWWKAAVVLLPLLLATGYLYKYTRGNSWAVYTATSVDKDSLVLPDGTAVYLQPGTTLSYQRNFKEREVRLQQGEAFFKVARDEQHTFRISAANATIQVLGTAFNVKTTAAYTDVAIWEGKVSLDGSRQLPVILSAGNMGIVDAGGQATKLAGDYQYRCGWANNELVFNNQSVAVVIRTLEAYYHVTLTVPDPTLLNRRVTVRFSHLPVAEALAVLTEILDYEILIKREQLIH